MKNSIKTVENIKKTFFFIQEKFGKNHFRYSDFEKKMIMDSRMDGVHKMIFYQLSYGRAINKANNNYYINAYFDYDFQKCYENAVRIIKDKRDEKNKYKKAFELAQKNSEKKTTEIQNQKFAKDLATVELKKYGIDIMNEEDAIHLLKSKGYKISKPVTVITYEEL